MRKFSRLLCIAFLAGAALAPLSLVTGCAQRGLAPGAYGGDKVLVEIDEAIATATAVFDEVIGLADRNPGVIAANSRLAARVASIRAELDGKPDAGETLTRLFLIRDAYEAARSTTAAAAAREEIDVARAALATVRALLPLFASQSSTPNPR